MKGLVRAYSLKKEGEIYLAKHFQVKEFACKDGSDTVFVSCLLPVLLEAIRGVVGEPVHINSAYRTESHNAAEGGAEYSMHLYGRAADIRCENVKPEELARIARKIMPNFGGVGVYDWGIHVDDRPDKADWNG